MPYGNIHEQLLSLVYPSGHPYHHPVIGSLVDLDNATLEEVAQFFRTWYVPGNAVLAVTGDIAPEQVFTAAEEYFGAVPAGDVPPDVPACVLGPAGGESRDDTAEPVPFPMIAVGFRLPPNSATDPDLCNCLGGLRVMGAGRLLAAACCFPISRRCPASHFSQSSGRPLSGFSSKGIRIRVDPAASSSLQSARSSHGAAG